MIPPKRARPRLIIRGTLTLAILGSLTSSPAGIQAQPTTIVAKQTRQTLLKKPLRFVVPPLGAPGKRIGAATRGECPRADKRLIALIPGTNIGLTSADRPNFWFYIPYQGKNSVEFVLQSVQDKQLAPVYTTTLDLTGTPGIVKVSLPEDAPPLESGKNYQWSLSLVCSSPDESITVQGYVKRVPLSAELTNQLEKATTPQERIPIYAENGLWYQALNEIIEERKKNPQDVQLNSYWEDLLQAVQLKNVASQPIVDCCTPQSPTANR